MAVKKYLTLVFEYETDEELVNLREISMQKNCRAWSMDHEMMRVDLLRQAIDDEDLVKADEYQAADDVINLIGEIRSC